MIEICLPCCLQNNQACNSSYVDLNHCYSILRNGLLTEHNILEVNGQNVVGLKVTFFS